VPSFADEIKSEPKTAKEDVLEDPAAASLTVIILHGGAQWRFPKSGDVVIISYELSTSELIQAVCSEERL
jgi:hypothetical protein